MQKKIPGEPDAVLFKNTGYSQNKRSHPKDGLYHERCFSRDIQFLNTAHFIDEP